MESIQSRQEYIARINKVIDYIKSHLDEELSVDHLAEVSCFSKFHFHRIFRSVVGETVNQFVKRSRIERAAFYLRNNPGKSVSEVATDSGFINLASFARTFRETTGASATEWKQKLIFENSKNCKTDRTDGKVIHFYPTYLASSSINQEANMIHTPNKIQVEIRELPAMHVAYVRSLSISPQDGPAFEQLFDKLFKWAGPRGFIYFPQTKALTVYRSNPELSTDGKMQADVCITVPEGTAGEGEIGIAQISGGQYAVIHLEGDIRESGEAWTYVYKEWLSDNGYQPDNRNFYINHLNNPKEHPQQLHMVDMCIPVKPL
ncbi:AraC family transcriptional regulator [Xanthocytophaga agilis]|uniref:GyrI-like domain-containing protein n=1 Tax=Xanthocytophaga agilis TaxID=3048010 RepID=A0AAE3R632_9BACT|nr:GyrI-like domain-containing protein [Xanthocytophaga agilis]MDJ1504321.1 GyrI-like domain-containing protein [Xanthocytophaga agilis]